MTIQSQVALLGDGPLTETGLREHIWPLFSRVLQRDEIYLANHSLGRPLDRMAEDVQEGLDHWYSRLDGVWDDDAWPAEISRFRGGLAQLIGLSDPSAVVPKMSAGQGLRAVLNAIPKDIVRVVATRSEFDSLDFILKTYIKRGRAEVTWVEPDPSALFSTDSILDAIDSKIDLVVVSAVVFSTGQVTDHLDHIIAEAHACGALVLVDAYHAAGVISLSMDELDCDFMVGGSYKYTRGGPGACWLAIHPRVLSSELRTLDTGWFAKRDPFSYARPDEPLLAEGGDSWLESTPGVIPLYQARSGLELTLALGVDRLREYGLKQLAALRESFAEHRVPCFQPANSNQFGAFALLPSPDAPALCAALLREGVNTDCRSGNVRFGPDILNSAEELELAARAAAKCLASWPR